MTKDDYNKKYYQEHKEKLKADQRKRYQDNREEEKAKRRQYRQDNIEKMRAYDKILYQKHKESKKAHQRKYNQTRRVEQKAYSKEYRQEYPEQIKAMEQKRGRDPERIYNNYRYSASERGIEFNLSKERFFELLEMPCAFAEIDGERCGNSRGEQRVGIDRLSNGAYKDSDVIPLCHYHNTIKGAITPQMIELLYKLCIERGILKPDKQ